jgi:acetoin utilization protein AcuB
MINNPLPVRRYMSHGAFTIGRDQPLARAHASMREHNIRHLPVLEGGALIGVLSRSDVDLFEALRGADARDLSVEEAMSREVYAVGPNAPLVTIARVMSEQKLDIAVVMERGHVLGVLTAVDLARALVELLQAGAWLPNEGEPP